MKRRMIIMAVCLVASGLLSGVPQRGFADDQAKKEKKASEEKKGDKEKSSGGKFRDGVNRAWEGFKKETAKGKKNLNDLYEREKAK